MAVLSKTTKESIEKARQLLLAELYRGDGQDDRFAKKEAVRQLLGLLIAARESGMSFENITQIFEKAGLQLTPATLKQYYFELKTEGELADAAQKHAQKLIRTKEAIDRQLLEKHSQHGQQVALAHLGQQEPALYNAFGNGVAIPVSQPSVGMSRSASTANPRTKPTLVKAKPSAAALAKMESQAPARDPPPAFNADPAPADSQLPETSTTGTGEFLLLEEIEQQSLATEERTVLEADLLLKDDGTVVYATGLPFKGYLSKKQLHLLRSVGKIIATTRGRSSQDFVKMPPKL